MLSEEEFYKRISENLRLLRNSCGYTQEQLASVLGCERSTYTYLEKGKSYLSLYKLYILCEFYCLSPETMWSDLQANDNSPLRKLYEGPESNAQAKSNAERK